MPKVVVLGGGVAGLSAAHELIDRGFEVEVYERNPDWGGKARSLDVPGPLPPGQKPLPGEHGFRFFPGFYKHVIDTMKNIPRPGGGSVFDNLVHATEIAIAQETRPPWVFAADTPTSVPEWIEAVRDLLSAKDLGVKKKRWRSSQRCQLWPVEEPDMFKPLRQIDALIYAADKNSEPLGKAAPEVLGLGSASAALSPAKAGGILPWLAQPAALALVLSNAVFLALVIYLATR